MPVIGGKHGGMRDRSILITGCSTGIGLTCALGMKARGWRVFATARQGEDIERLAQAGLDVLYMDYDEPDSVAACAAQVAEKTAITACG